MPKVNIQKKALYNNFPIINHKLTVTLTYICEKMYAMPVVSAKLPTGLMIG